MKIAINGVEYVVKYTIRALFIFEQITNRPFEVKTTMDNFVFFYSMILANNKDVVLEWDDFLDAIDEDPTIVLKLNNILNEYKKKDDLFAGDGSDDPSKKN